MPVSCFSGQDFKFYCSQLKNPGGILQILVSFPAGMGGQFSLSDGFICLSSLSVLIKKYVAQLPCLEKRGFSSFLHADLSNEITFFIVFYFS